MLPWWVKITTEDFRVIPSEKKWKRLTPQKSSIFGIYHLHCNWTGYWWFGSFLDSWGPRGARGGALGGFWGVWRTQNCPFPHGTNFGSEMSCFGSEQLVTLCFWYFWPNLGPQGPKNAVFARNRVCRKVHIPEKHPPKSCSYCTKTLVGDHILMWNIDFSGNPLKIFHHAHIGFHQLPTGSTGSNWRRRSKPLKMDPERTKTVHMDMLHRYWVHWTTLGGPRGV